MADVTTGEKWLDWFLSECQINGMSDGTVYYYGRHIREYLAAAGDVAPERLFSREPVQRWLAVLRDRGDSPSKRAQAVYALRSFAKWAARNGLASCAYMDAVDAPRQPRRIPWVPSPEDMARLVNAPLTVAYARMDRNATGFMRLRDAAILETLYATGMRAGELCNMEVRDFNPEAELFMVRQGKGRKDRLVMMTARARAAVARWLELRQSLHPDHGRVWIHPDGRPFDRLALYHMVRRYGRAIELTHEITPHTIRHATATHCLDGGMDLRYVQVMLGHSNVMTTAIYTHVSSKKLRLAHRKYHPRAARRRKRGHDTQKRAACVD